MFPMMSDLEHLFICLFYLLYVSNKCSNFCYIKDMVFVFLLLNFESSLNILDNSPLSEDFPGGTSGKESACQCRRHEGCGFSP